jgi:TolB protein
MNPPSVQHRSLRGPLRLCASAVMLSALVTRASAQREPVFRQVKLPHNYYYREMYLPQVTSGPSAVTWSPDGRSLIYSMQGSLWRQRIGDSTAEQLTAGPSYDYQPDWSPDGKRVVYVSCRNDALELWLLDVTTLESRPLLTNGAVNLEPRWSPTAAASPISAIRTEIPRS